MLPNASVGSRCVQKRPVHCGPRIVEPPSTSPDSTRTSPAIRTNRPRSGGAGGASGSSADGAAPASCSIQTTASWAEARVAPCSIRTPPVRCQTSYEPSVQRAACGARMVIASRASTAGTSILPASAIAAARPRAGTAASTPAAGAGSGTICPCAVAVDNAMRTVRATRLPPRPREQRGRTWGDGVEPWRRTRGDAAGGEGAGKIRGVIGTPCAGGQGIAGRPESRASRCGIGGYPGLVATLPRAPTGPVRQRPLPHRRPPVAWAIG